MFPHDSATPQYYRYTGLGQITYNSVPDDVTENNLSHDSAGTTVVVTDSDNLTLDFGFTPPLPDLNLTKELDKTSSFIMLCCDKVFSRIGECGVEHE